MDFELTVTATATETANSDQSTRTDTINVEVSAVADQPTLTVPATVTVSEDTSSAAFTISSALVDTDASETLTLSISNIPAGATLTDGSQTFTATNGNRSVDVTNWSLTNLSVTPPADSDADFLLTVTATATETANGDQSIRTDTIAVEVTAVADQPTLTVPATVTVDEDTQSAAFTITSALVDTDASETLLLEISNVPVGTTLTDGRDSFTASAGNTSVDVTDWRLNRLKITPPADSDTDFVLTVTATATEAANSDQSTRTDTINVEVTAVADLPTLTVPATVTFDEDTRSSTFSVDSELSDADGSETLTLLVSDIPAEVTLSDGIHSFTGSVGNSAVDVTAWSLHNLTLTAPVDSDEDFVLQVTAVATEAANGSAISETDVISVEVEAVADKPTLVVPATIRTDSVLGSAEFTITSALRDTDGSETLELLISGLPKGTTISDGSNSFTATIRRHEVDIAEWSLTTLTILTPLEVTEDFALTVTASAVEQENGDTFSLSDTIAVEVEAVADEPTLTVPRTVRITEDVTSTPFVISAELADTDGSEVMTLTVSDIPEGAMLSDGTHSFVATAGVTTVAITDWDLTQLTITAPANSDVDFDLTVTVTATETMNSDAVERNDSIAVRVRAVADQPTLTVPATVTTSEDTPSPSFAVSSSLTDTDGSESLSIEIGNVPREVTISDGTHSFTSTRRAGTVDVTELGLEPADGYSARSERYRLHLDGNGYGKGAGQ